jgi:UTP--glucose-1-phosphate uridylyltransferase
VPNRQGFGVVGLVEKPDLDKAPSNLASIGRYVLTPDIFETLWGLSSGSGGEIQLADAINIQAKRGSVESIQINGLRFDCGSVDEFIEASNFEFNRRKNK